MTGAFGLQQHPTNGLVYTLLQVSGSNNRMLATLNLNTGVATMVGSSTSRFSGMTFHTNGTLYAVTGDGDPVCAECLYTINTNTGVATLATSLGNGTNGEAIAFNPGNGYLEWGIHVTSLSSNQTI